MSKKRKSPESSNDEQTLEGSDSVFQHEDNTKRAKLDSLSDTTLQDLPVELIECILVKAVAMEVKAMKLAKSVWKEKADLVISRLRTVSLQWSSILSTNFFRNELHRTLDGYAQETIRWEILPQPSNQIIMHLTTLREEVFMICLGSTGLNVYDRNNMAEAKEVIPLGVIYLGNMVACSVSNCVYLLNVERDGPLIIRITKDEHQFKVSVWIKNLSLPSYGVGPISVSANGSLIILSRQRSPTVVGIYVYNVNGFVQREIMLSPAIYGFRDVSSVIQKANGSLVLVCHNDQYNAKLLEIDKSGRFIREYQSSLTCSLGHATISEDIYGRILVNYPYSRIELLDSEFNLLDTAVPRLVNQYILTRFQMHYNSERHEMVGFYQDWNAQTSDLVIIRLIEE